jgi:hypothetical protein
MLCDDLQFRGPKMINDSVEAEATWTVTLQIPDWPSGRERVVPFWSSVEFRKRALRALPLNGLTAWGSVVRPGGILVMGPV